MNLNLCLLVIGSLGKSGAISLESINNIPSTRVCIAANKSGKEWLRNSAAIDLQNRFCFHDDIVEEFELLSLGTQVQYSQYRSSDFRKLTVLKWDLLRDSLEKHEDCDGVFFSDLDIFWLKNPLPEIHKSFSASCIMLVQNDSSKVRPVWACTGVMAWKRTSESLVQLNRLRNLHVQQINLGRLQDDEDTFNQMIASNTYQLAFEKLSATEFVVGRNFLNLVLQVSGFKRERAICFHANYLTGLDRKSESLKSVKKWHDVGTFPVREVFRFILRPKIERLRKSIRKQIEK